MLDRLPLWLRAKLGLTSRFAQNLSSRFLGRLALGVGAFALLYYPIGMMIVHHIDDNTALEAEVQSGQSRAVATAAALIHQQVDANPWVANDPWFYPGAALDNMPNFQQGVVYALSRFAIEMSDQIGRTRGSSQVDADLDKAAGLLKYAGDVWVVDFSVSLLPTTASDTQYRAAQRSLIAYNKRLGEGQATFETRADNLQATLERIGADLGSASAVIDQHIRESSGTFFDFHADDIYYRNKGRLYAYYMLLRAMRDDFKNVIVEKDVANAWDQMLDSLKIAAEAQPLVVINADPDSMWRPSHLTAQGFYLLRARTQIKEVANILLK